MVKVYMVELKENGQTKARKVFADAKEAADCALKTKEKSMTTEEEVKQLIQDVKKYNLPEVTTDYKFLTKVGPLPTAEEICKNLRASKAMKELAGESSWNEAGFAKGFCSAAIHAHAISDEERTKNAVAAARASIIYIERYQEEK